jgi:hypothetical protein
MSTIRLGNRTFRLPQSRFARILIGVLLVTGGILGFLPILGFWMIPLGFFVLSLDLPLVRRWRRRWQVKYARWRRGNLPEERPSEEKQ